MAYADRLFSLTTRWDEYERDVKNLLNWIMDEANRFSGEVTTQGDKGIEDHIESCKVHVVHVVLHVTCCIVYCTCCTCSITIELSLWCFTIIFKGPVRGFHCRGS